MDVLSRLSEIVGTDFASNRQEELYLYSRDSGAQRPREVAYVVMPKTVEEVQKIVRLANEERIPITPMGGGFTTSALAVPTMGGILLDMKRMDRIIEVNEKGRYAVVEAGVSQGALKGYLNKHHPRLQHCTPEAPPTVTIVGNALILGHGHITSRQGINSESINGIEAVLPDGEVYKIGSCSLSPYWFTRGPLPDLAGLFIGWLGTTGVVTKMSIRLFPKPRYRDALAFFTDNIDLIPEIVFEVTQLDLLENFFLWGQEKPKWMDHAFFVAIVSAQSEEEMELKKKAHRNVFQKYREIEPIEEIPPALRKRVLDVPPFAATAADFRKGGGFEYTGAILHVEKVPQAWVRGKEIARKYGVLYSHAIQVLRDQSVMFAFDYSFNRADAEDVERTRKAIDESDRLALELGGMVWRPELSAQKLMMGKMDPNTLKLIETVKKVLDPNGIMNPGNWGE
jgi:glycolate oxidase